jgi:sialate O-acetylesterase
MKNKWLSIAKIFMATSLVSLGLQSKAAITPNPVFQSGMVLQRDVIVPIWGTATPSATITVTCNSDITTATADENGKWKALFPATTYGGPYTMTIQSSIDTETAVEMTDVYFGDVFYCSGQSNMELEVQSCDNYTTVQAAANDQTIRQMKISKGVSKELSEELPSVSWKPATSAYVGSFSAAAYFCVLEMKKLAAYKDIPIGILNVSYGGARVEAWMSEDMLGYDEEDVRLAQGENERQPTLIYNKMVNPIIGLPFKAMLWYQAESNCDVESDAIVYSQQFNKMISSYRALWENEFPVVWVQLPNYKSETRTEVNNTPSHLEVSNPWITMRNEQTKSLSVLPKSAEIITIDAGVAGNIHPTDKQTIGTRLALAVRQLVYGEAIAGYSPRYKSHVVNGDGSVTIDFDNIGDGLIAKDSTSGKLTWFSVVTTTGLKQATAVLENNQVTVSCDVPFTAIRYAWDRCPGGINFYGKSGDVLLPADPFYIDVTPTTFGIQSFSTNLGSTTDQTGEGGDFVTFTWKTGGNVTAYFNDEEVDPNTSMKVMLGASQDYTLRIVDNEDAANVLSQTIHFTVTPAKPTITLFSQSGVLANPNDEIEIATNAAAPGGYEVSKVELYLNGTLLTTLTSAPFTYKWTAPAQVADYTFYGIVYNNNLDVQYNSTQSNDLVISVTNTPKTRFEAENATLLNNTGGSVKVDEFCSGKMYMDLQAFKLITFNNIYAPAAGDYQIYISYMCNYGTPKEQYLYVNSTSLGTVTFESTDWAIYKATVPLTAGKNSITIKSSWGWMGLDYIDILGVSSPVEEVSGVNSSMIAYCNTSSQIAVNYETAARTITFELFDMQGKKLAVDTVDNQGTYSFGKNLIAGTYVVKMHANDEVLVKQVIVK